MPPRSALPTLTRGTAPRSNRTTPTTHIAPTKLDLTLTPSSTKKKLAPLPSTTSNAKQPNNTSNNNNTTTTPIQQQRHRPPTLPSRLRGRVEQNRTNTRSVVGGNRPVSNTTPTTQQPLPATPPTDQTAPPNEVGDDNSNMVDPPSTQQQEQKHAFEEAPPTHQQEERPQNTNISTTNFPEPALPPHLAKAVWTAVDGCRYVYNLKTDPTGIKRRIAREEAEEKERMMKMKTAQKGKSSTFVRGRKNGSTLIVDVTTLKKTGSRSVDAAVLKSAVDKCKNVLDDVELPQTTVVIDDRVVASPSGKYAFTFVQTDCVWEREGTSSHSMTYITVRVDVDEKGEGGNNKNKKATTTADKNPGADALVDCAPSIEVLANYFRDSYSAHMDVESSGVSSGWSGAGHVHWNPSQPSDLVAKIDGEWMTRRFDSGPPSTWPSFSVGVSPS